MTYKNVFAKEIWIDKIPLIKNENKAARVTKKQFVMWENKKNDVKNTPPETIRNEKNSVITKEQNSKNIDCGFTGRFAKRFSGERPDPLGFELTFYLSWSELFWRVLDRGALLRACISQAPAKVPFEIYSEILRPQTQ